MIKAEGQSSQKTKERILPPYLQSTPAESPQEDVVPDDGKPTLFDNPNLGRIPFFILILKQASTLR